MTIPSKNIGRAGVWAVMLLALGGAWISGALLSAHDGGWSSGGQASGFLLEWCGQGGIESARCTEVLDSRWGAIDVTLGGQRTVIPVAYFGLAYFVSVALLLAVAGRPGRDDRWGWRILLGLVCGGAVSSLTLLGLMAAVLREWCPLCVASHVINLCMAAIVLRWARVSSRGRKTEPSASEFVRNRERMLTRPLLSPTMSSGLLAALLATAGLWHYYDAVHQARRYWRRMNVAEGFIEKLESDERFVVREFFADDPVDLPLRNLDRAEAAPTGPKLVIFSDFDCSACGCFVNRWERRIVPALGEGVHVEVRHALMSLMNGEGDEPILSADDPRVRPALAMEAARLQGGQRVALQMHNLQFRHRHDQPEPDHAALAQEIGIDPVRLLEDMRREDLLDIVRDDVRLARRLGVHTTPAVFLDSRRVPELCVRSDVFWDAMGSGAAHLAVTQRGTNEEADPT